MKKIQKKTKQYNGGKGEWIYFMWGLQFILKKYTILRDSGFLDKWKFKIVIFFTFWRYCALCESNYIGVYINKKNGN